MRVWFDHAESGLTSDGAPAGFEIAGADGKFVPATAKIEGSTVVVQAAGRRPSCVCAVRMGELDGCESVQ